MDIFFSILRMICLSSNVCWSKSSLVINPGVFSLKTAFKRGVLCLSLTFLSLSATSNRTAVSTNWSTVWNVPGTNDNIFPTRSGSKPLKIQSILFASGIGIPCSISTSLQRLRMSYAKSSTDSSIPCCLFLSLLARLNLECLERKVFRKRSTKSSQLTGSFTSFQDFAFPSR